MSKNHDPLKRDILERLVTVPELPGFALGVAVAYDAIFHELKLRRRIVEITEQDIDNCAEIWLLSAIPSAALRSLNREAVIQNLDIIHQGLSEGAHLEWFADLLKFKSPILLDLIAEVVSQAGSLAQKKAIIEGTTIVAIPFYQKMYPEAMQLALETQIKNNP